MKELTCITKNKFVRLLSKVLQMKSAIIISGSTHTQGENIEQ